MKTTTIEMNTPHRYEKSNSIKTAVLVHGMNLQPSQMELLTPDLINLGYERIIPVTLSGHSRKTGSMKLLPERVTAELWMEDLKRSIPEDVTSFDGFGFSLGGLLLSLYATQGAQRVNRVFLFAPAYALNPLPDRLMRRVYNLSPVLGGFPIPSFARPSVRANPLLSVSFYSSLADLYSRRSEIPESLDGHIFIDPRDELVSATGVEQFIEQRRMVNMCVHRIQSKTYPRHLSFAERYVDKSDWDFVLEKIRGQNE